MEDAFIIQGGTKLVGDVTLSGAKNLALKLIIASLLIDSKVVLQNVPRINDVQELLHLLGGLGVSSTYLDRSTLEIDSTTLTGHDVDLLHASKTRVSFLLFAPLLHKFGTCKIPNPGGCRIGLRPIDRTIAGLQAFGATVDYDSLSGYYVATKDSDPQGTYKFEKPSHTGTELLIMYGVLGNGKITIENAAHEPEIDELIAFLNSAGAKIKRQRSTIHIDSVSALHAPPPFHIFSDRNEAVTFAVMGLASGGSVRLTNIESKYLLPFIEVVKKSGARVEEKAGGIVFESTDEIKPVDIETAPHPGFMTDWQPNWAVYMTQSSGASQIHDTVFENRFAYVPELLKLGADIEYIDPKVHDPQKTYHFQYDKEKPNKHMIRIVGGAPLHGGVMRIFDLRAGATVLIAGLIAQGESILVNASILERGYEDIVSKVAALGGIIKKL